MGVLLAALGEYSKFLHVGAHALVLPTLLVVILWVAQSSTEGAARWLIVLLSVEVVWVALLMIQLVSPVPVKRATFGITRGVGALVPTFWLLFILHYTGRENWLTRPRKVALGFITVTVFLLPATNALTGLVVQDLDVADQPFTHLVGEPTLIQWGIYALLYPLVFAGLLLLVDFIFSTRHLSRTQTATIIIAGTIAMVTNVLMPLRLGPAPGFDYSGIGTGVFGAAVAWALYNERLFQVAPVARDSIFESFSDPLIAVDTDGAVVDFNSAATQPFPELGSSAGEQLTAVVPKLSREGDEFPEELSITTAEGERSFQVETSQIEAGDRRVGTVLQLREVTELEAYAEKLERRTQQLEIKTEQLEGFASSVSHDLRNPINVAKGRIDIAQETGELHHLETADDALDRGLDTIEELLDLARSGQTIGDPTEVELGSVVEEAWAAVETPEADLVNEFDGQKASVDPGRVQGLFENLFRNAIEHAGEDVSIRVSSTPEGFIVADDGPGIPEEKREQVFDHGYTSDDGTGIGLAKVESISIAHEWVVSIDESDDGGARFRFENVF